MPQPKKYRTDAERYRAYRERKRDKEKALRRELALLGPSSASGKRGATVTLAQAALCHGLAELHEEIIRRRQKIKTRHAVTQGNPPAVQALEPFELLNYIEGELDRLMK